MLVQTGEASQRILTTDISCWTWRLAANFTCQSPPLYRESLWRSRLWWCIEKYLSGCDDECCILLVLCLAAWAPECLCNKWQAKDLLTQANTCTPCHSHLSCPHSCLQEHLRRSIWCTSYTSSMAKSTCVKSCRNFQSKIPPLEQARTHFDRCGYSLFSWEWSQIAKSCAYCATANLCWVFWHWPESFASRLSKNHYAKTY